MSKSRALLGVLVLSVFTPLIIYISIKLDELLGFNHLHVQLHINCNNDMPIRLLLHIAKAETVAVAIASLYIPVRIIALLLLVIFILLLKKYVDKSYAFDGFTRKKLVSYLLLGVIIGFFTHPSSLAFLLSFSSGTHLFRALRLPFQCPCSLATSRMVVWFIISVFYEELVFRSYILSQLQKNWGPWVALILSTYTFGMMHLLSYPFLGALFITFTSLDFGLIYLLTESVWFSIAMHFGFDFGLYLIYAAITRPDAFALLLEPRIEMTIDNHVLQTTWDVLDTSLHPHIGSIHLSFSMAVLLEMLLVFCFQMVLFILTVKKFQRPQEQQEGISFWWDRYGAPLIAFLYSLAIFGHGIVYFWLRYLFPIQGKSLSIAYLVLAVAITLSLSFYFVMYNARKRRRRLEEEGSGFLEES